MKHPNQQPKPTTKPMLILPFGSIASVTAFLRVSLALWKVGSTLLHLMWSVYFDDFLCLARSSESKHVDFCVDALFSLLGWKIPKNKLLDCNTFCKVLGVQLDLRQSGDRLCFVANTEERVEELVNELDEALRKILSRSEGEKLRGTLQFASSSFWKEVQKVTESPIQPCHPREEDFVSTHSIMPL